MRKTILVLFSLFTYLSGFAQIGIIEGLNTTTLPTGWTSSGFSNTTTSPCEGTHAWRINFYSDYDPWEGWDYGTLTGSITSPNLTAASNGTDINVTFDWKANEYSTGDGVGYTMYVEYSLNNGTNWIQIGSPIVASSNTTCDTFSHTIPGASVPVGSNFKFRVRGAWSSGDSYFWIDAISVTQTTDQVPACITLSSPANGAVNVSSGLITWNVPNGIPTGYKLKVGTTPGGSQIVNSEDVGPATSYNLDTLISGATYYVTVIPYNDNGDAISCVETSFTACGSFSDFTQGFETTPTGGIMPECWSRKYVSSSTASTVNVSSTYAKTGSRSLAFSNSGDAAAKLYAITPILTALQSQTHRIKFSARGSANTTIEVGTMSDPTDDATFNPLMTFPMTTSFQDFSVNFNFSTTDQYVAFRANFGSTYTYSYIDDLTWEPMPACPDVAGLSFENVESTTATINWEAGDSETAWQYAIGATTVTDPATLTAVDVTTGNPTADLSDLTPNTAYKFWVRANCGSGSFGAWAGPVSFTTLCEAEAAPTAVQTFETAVPGCWTEATGALAPSITLAGTSSAWGAATSFANATGGTNKAIKINIYGSKNDWIISNQIDLGDNVGDYRVSYRMALTSYDGTAAQSTMGTHKVSVIVSTDGGITWSDSDIIKSYTGGGSYSNTGQIEKINLSAYSGIVKIAFVASTTAYSPDLHFHIDDFAVEPLPECGDVTELSYENVTSSSATINWVPGDSETAWQYAIGDITVTDPATLTAVDVTGGNPTTDLSDLTSNTAYKFWVRANCGSGSFGAWAGPITFTTACTPFAVPSALENFDGTTGTALPGCWSTTNISGTTAWTGLAPTTGDITTTVSGTRIAAKVYTNSDALLISTPFDYSNITEGTRVNLYLHRHASAAATDKYTIYASTTPSLEEAELLLEVFSKTTIAPTVAATGFYNYTAEIPESFNGASQVYIIVQGYTNNGLSSYTLGVDDFKVEYLPACPDVASLSFENVESTSATINWEAGNSETAWQYAIGASTVTDPATLTAVDVTGGNPTADLSDLAPNTTYKFWVRANCGSDSFGAWAGPVSFTTLCAAYGDFIQGFETTPTASTMPDCWSRKYVSSSTYATVNVSSSYAKTGTRSLAFYNAGDATAKLYAVTPMLTALENGTHRIKFSARGSAGTTIEVGTMSDPTDETTFTSVETFEMTTSFQDFAFNFDYATTDQYVALRANFGATYLYAYVDDVIWEPIPSCPDVAGLSFENVESTTATINWAAGNSETAWQYAIGATTVTDPATLTAVDVTGGNPTADLSDLTPNTTYKFWVRANCGSDSFGGWIGPVSFTTACVAEMAPTILQSFETAVPGCWSEATGALAPSITLAGTTSAWGAATSFANATGGTNKGIKINLYGPKNDWIISNQIDLGNNVGDYRVSYRMALTSYDGTAAQSTMGTHKVSVIVSTDGGETWSDSDIIKSYTGAGNYSNTGQMEKIDLSAYSGIVKIAFVATTTAYSPDLHFHIDDFSVEPLPTCADVFNLSYTDVTSSSATINWQSNGSETAWQYAIGAATVTDPETLTAVDVTGGNPTADLSDLTSNTAYKFWVRSNCGSGSLGAWAGPVTFTTACTPFAVPSTLENFDGTTGTALPGCWSTANISGTTAWTGMTPGTTGDITSTVSGTRIVAKVFTNSDALLISTPFDYSSITDATRVNLYLHRHALAAVADKYTIYASTTPSLEGAELLLEVFSKTTIAPTVAATGFYNYTADIPESFNGASQVYIIVQGYTNNGLSSYTLGVDDFKIEFNEDLKNPSMNAASFKLYPNPVKDVLNISYTQNITNVEVFNMLGQQVLAKSVNATEGKVDMSNLAAGNYLVKVAADNQVKTIKVIKQ